MRFTPLELPGAYLIDLEPLADHRGINARTWCAREFSAQGLPDFVAQINIIRNEQAGTLRGLHWQAPPAEESKLFRVTRGAIHDIIIDLRPESSSYRDWLSVQLRAEDDRMLFVPERFGQGFQSLEDHTELTYQVTAFHAPGHGTGMRHDDPAFTFDWPLSVSQISDVDRSWPDYEDDRAPHLDRTAS